MASKFQNRLVGTIVLVAVGVIVLPDVLDGKKTHYKEEIASIPIKPETGNELESFEVLDPVDDGASLPDSPVEVVIEDVPEPRPEQPPEIEQPEPLPVVVKEVTERNDYQDSAWIIQLMALKNSDNAKKLVTDLQKRGYQAHTKPENGFTRVIIGPDVSKSKLEQQVIELEKITGSKGQLLKFKPLNP
ncbi:SPOR domain-containing protein [Vibrio japonicus]|uniref:SPOR domain-containing protein n=1 Tax=Vibrio japonicus TaxID=1824638 RepID=A0ABY5LFG6_9VIBR|nr:SPOR domain-containing protein [Vibrio japonicus]UUM29817.1 SPOR domain-containing protein [Vibrio japonicus]